MQCLGCAARRLLNLYPIFISCTSQLIANYLFILFPLLVTRTPLAARNQHTLNYLVHGIDMFAKRDCSPTSVCYRRLPVSHVQPCNSSVDKTTSVLCVKLNAMSRLFKSL